jgi:uncharacterized ParB-like nuclease family protein
MNNAYLSNEEAQSMNNAMPIFQNLEIGSKLQTALANGVALGTKWYLDPLNGSDSNDGLSAQTAFKTLPVAYAALTEKKNEVLFIVGGSTSIVLSAAFVWAKSYTHLVGLCPETPFGGRARIGHNADFTSMFTITASGCLFKNIHWQCGRGSTTNVNCVVVSGTSSYNVFEGCHFDAMLHATEAGGTQAWRALVLQNGARSNAFKGCTFGEWTVVWASASGALVEFLGLNAGSHFIGCRFITNTSSTSMVPVKSDVDVGGVAGYVAFEGCEFINANAKPDVMFGAPSTGKLIINDCRAFNATNWSANSSSVFNSSGPASIADGGLAVVIS